MEYSARHNVIDYSVELEKSMNIFLSGILQIDFTKTKVGRQPLEYLSFNQKISMIKDLEIIDAEQKAKLILFSEIRNAFAHNADIKRFEDYFLTRQEQDKTLKKFYSSDPKAVISDKIYFLYFNRLYQDVMRTTLQFAVHKSKFEIVDPLKFLDKKN